MERAAGGLLTGRRLFGLVLSVALAASCGQTLQGNAQIADAFARRASGIEVTADGAVERLLADDPGPDGTHQRFIVRLDGGTQTVLIEHNISIAPRVPVAAADQVTVHGEYVWNEQGGLIHFTHHDPQHTHEDGYIVLGGTRYSTRVAGSAHVVALRFASRVGVVDDLLRVQPDAIGLGLTDPAPRGGQVSPLRT